jgi:succinyl-CoA synthetase beta subunit
MATMDCIKLAGGEPANFLDLGGGAGEKQVAEAFTLLNKDTSVKCILVNIFGGIMRCDWIALGIVKAAADTGLQKPVVVRLQGTNREEGEKIIEDRCAAHAAEATACLPACLPGRHSLSSRSGLRMITAADLEDASTKAVRISQILAMAEQAKVRVNFELPL